MIWSIERYARRGITASRIRNRDNSDYEVDSPRGRPPPPPPPRRKVPTVAKPRVKPGRTPPPITRSKPKPQPPTIRSTTVRGLTPYAAGRTTYNTKKSLTPAQLRAQQQAANSPEAKARRAAYRAKVADAIEDIGDAAEDAGKGVARTVRWFFRLFRRRRDPFVEVNMYPTEPHMRRGWGPPVGDRMRLSRVLAGHWEPIWTSHNGGLWKSGSGKAFNVQNPSAGLKYWDLGYGR